LFRETLATVSANATTTSNDGAGETQIQRKTSVPDQIGRKTLTRDGEDTVPVRRKSREKPQYLTKLKRKP
jgi:hypothetical protein